MKQMTEARLKELLTEAYNAGFDSSRQGFCGEFVADMQFYVGEDASARVENAANAFDQDAQEWVITRDDKIKKLISQA